MPKPPKKYPYGIKKEKAGATRSEHLRSTWSQHQALNQNKKWEELKRLWRAGTARGYDAHTSSSGNGESNEVPVFYRSRSTRASDERSSGAQEDPLRLLWEFRTPTEHHRLPNFPTQQHSRQQTYIHNGDMRRRRGGFTSSTRLRETFLHSPSRSTQQTITQVPPVVENSKSTILSKLKKTVYNPTPKRLARKVSLYYRDNGGGNGLKEKKEDGMRCAICLEDFEAKEEVMLTPCNHMFHEDCIVPWLTSKGQCPVCRFVISEGVRENPSSSLNRNDNDYMANLEPSNQLIAGELLSILRAMEEAFHLGSVN